MISRLESLVVSVGVRFWISLELISGAFMDGTFSFSTTHLKRTCCVMYSSGPTLRLVHLRNRIVYRRGGGATIYYRVLGLAALSIPPPRNRVEVAPIACHQPKLS